MNDREIATLIWLGIGLALAVANSDLRASIWEIVKAAVHPKLLGSVLAFAGWIVALVVFAYAVGLWESDVLTDTVAWFVTVGLGLLFSLKKVTEDGFWRTTLR